MHYHAFGGQALRRTFRYPAREIDGGRTRGVLEIQARSEGSREEAAGRDGGHVHLSGRRGSDLARLRGGPERQPKLRDLRESRGDGREQQGPALPERPRADGRGRGEDPP